MSEHKNEQSWNYEERNNVVGFFKLLLQVDKRNNPQLYNLDSQLSQKI